MKSSDIRRKFIEFYKARGHVEIPSAPLAPENDPTTLFTGSGMQPMVPYLLGQEHPAGKRLVDSQKSFRAQDIEEVGDNRHDTFFEMLGNWSLGDYFKREQIEWFWTFLTDKKVGIGLDPKRLYVSVFRGKPEINIPKDEEAVGIWQHYFQSSKIEAKIVDMAETHGIQGGRIFYYDEKKNWWSRAGVTANMPIGEPGGPDSEVFYDFGQHLGLHEKSIYKSEHCHPNCDCGRFLEIGNNVFMSYRKTKEGFVPLEKKNIDFGGGLERLTAATNNEPDMFRSDLFSSIVQIIEKFTGKSYEDEINRSSMRVIADHLRAATFLIKDGVIPSNKTQGYVLRRLLRRAAVKMHTLKGSFSLDQTFADIVDSIFDIYQETGYFDVSKDKKFILPVMTEELNRFSTVISHGLSEIQKLDHVDGKVAFDLFQSYGFPFEITVELFAQKGHQINQKEFQEEFEKHRERSRTASKGMFKGGLADHSEQVTKLHTATHLLHAALRKFLGAHVSQKGSNITAERLRFDFTHPAKLTGEERRKVETWVNEQIQKNHLVSIATSTLEKAKKDGALAFFGERYGNQVTVYSIGDTKTGIVSKEVCGGPHVGKTGVLGTFRLGKEESVGSGVRRLYATLS